MIYSYQQPQVRAGRNSDMGLMRAAGAALILIGAVCFFKLGTISAMAAVVLVGIGILCIWMAGRP